MQQLFQKGFMIRYEPRHQTIFIPAIRNSVKGKVKSKKCLAEILHSNNNQSRNPWIMLSNIKVILKLAFPIDFPNSTL